MDVLREIKYLFELSDLETNPISIYISSSSVRPADAQDAKLSQGAGNPAHLLM